MPFDPPDEPEPINGSSPTLRPPDNPFTNPPAALFDAPPGGQRIDERQLNENARLLEEKCREFSVDGSVVQIHPGPVVTTFEFKPHAGVKYSRVTRLADDLCLAMEADSGADRSDSGQVDHRHTDTERGPATRYRYARCSKRTSTATRRPC